MATPDTDDLQVIRGRIAANQRWSQTPDRTEATEPARQAFMARFEAEVDPDGTLDPELRAKLAENARKAYFQRMALASAKTRQANKRRRQQAAAAATHAALVNELVDSRFDEGAAAG